MPFHGAPACQLCQFRNSSSSAGKLELHTWPSSAPFQISRQSEPHACRHRRVTYCKLNSASRSHYRRVFGTVSHVQSSLVAMASEWAPAQLPLDQLGVGRPKVTSRPPNKKRSAATIHSPYSRSQQCKCIPSCTKIRLGVGHHQLAATCLLVITCSDKRGQGSEERRRGSGRQCGRHFPSELVDYDMLPPGHNFFRLANLRGAQSKVTPMYVCIRSLLQNHVRI